MSEAYTTMKIRMENKDAAKIAATIIEEMLRSNDQDETSRFETFLSKIKFENNTVDVENSCSLFAEDVAEKFPEAIKEIAKNETVDSFEAEVNWLSCNCGAELWINAMYNNGSLTIEMVDGEEFEGCCPECGEVIVNFEDYDPNKKYYCDDCETELTEEELFPYGLPQRTVETFEL